MNYKIPKQKHHQEGTDQTEHHLTSFTTDSPPSTTPSPMAQSSTSSHSYIATHSSMVFTMPPSSPGYYIPTFASSTTSSTSSSSSSYFTSVNGIVYNSVPSQSHYINPNINYADYISQQQQTPLLPLPIQRITNQQDQPGRRKRPVLSSSPSDQEPQPSTQNKRQKQRHQSPGVVSSEMFGNPVSPHSSSTTPLPSPILHHHQREINMPETTTRITTIMTGLERGEGSSSNSSIHSTGRGTRQRGSRESGSERDIESPETNVQEEPPRHNDRQSPPQQGPRQRTVRSIETQLSFLRDECATILMMLESLRNAFLADESNKQQHVKNKKGSALKDRKLAMEREMRIAYDDLMLQVRQLERKVERLEEQSRVIIGNERG